MPNINHQRKETAFFKSVAEIVTEEITNSNISYTTVTGVKLSNDSSHLNVYVTFESNKEKSMEALQRTSGFVRKRLAQSSNSRKVPEIHFKHDESFEQGKRIDDILEKIKNNEK